MSKACCISASGANAPLPSISAQIAQFCKIDAERTEKRLARIHEKNLQEDIRILKMSAGEAVALSCQRDNISRKNQKCYHGKNKTYYNKTAVALEINVKRWILSVGEKYANKEILHNCESFEIRQAICERIAKEHIAEFTITIPQKIDEDLKTARRRFSNAFNDFNRRFLKEKAADLFGNFVRVFEPHKSGVLHAHILIECKKSLRRGSIDFKWRKFGGAYLVKGETVADWVRDVWAMFQSGELEKIGIGKVHTLQPIRKGVKCFAKYISKYITKNLGSRPEFMKGLRTIAYSQGFLNGSRMLVYGYDRSEKIAYFSKTFGKWKTRYKRFPMFDINCPANRVRGAKLLKLIRFLGVDFEILKSELGSRWAWYLRNAIRHWNVDKKRFAKWSKWEKFAATSGLLGDRFKSVIKFKGDNEIFRFEDFKKIPTQIKLNRNFSVIGFIENGVFLPLKRIARTLFSSALGSVWGLRSRLHNRAEFLSKKKDLFERRRKVFERFENGEITVDVFHSFLNRFKVDLDSLVCGVKKWLDFKVQQPNSNFQTESKIEFKQMEFAL